MSVSGGLSVRVLAAVAAVAAVAGGLVLMAGCAFGDERGHVLAFSFGSQGSGTGQLDSPQGVAVSEATDRVYVVDSANDRVEYFSGGGLYEGQFNGSGTLPNEGVTHAPETLSDPGSIAVDNSTNPADPSRGDVYVVDQNHNVIDKFTASGEYISQITGTPGYDRINRRGEKEEVEAFRFHAERANGGSTSVAVDPNGRVWVTFNVQNPASGEFSWAAWYSDKETTVESKTKPGETEGVVPFEGEWPSGGGFFDPGLAVDARDELWARFEGLRFKDFVAKMGSSGDVLVPETCHEGGLWPAVEVSTGDGYVGHVGGWSRCAADGESLIEANSEGGMGTLAGLAVDSADGRVFVADESHDRVLVFELEPPGKPAVLEESVAEVSSSSALLQGRVNPRGEPGEAPTRYWFEYAPCGSEASNCATAGFADAARAGERSLAASFEASDVNVTIQNLAPGTAYRYRLVAENKQHGQTFGEEKVFVTQGVAVGPVLLDGRAAELVSPVSPLGATPLPIDEVGVVQAAVEGGRFTYLETSPSEDQPQGSESTYGVQVLGARQSGGGWVSRDIAAPHCRILGSKVGKGAEYRFFSEDLSLAVQEEIVEGARTPLEEEERRPRYFCPPPGEVAPQATEFTPLLRHNETCGVAPASCYAPMVYPGDVPAGTHFEGPLANEVVKFAGGTPDLTHTVISSPVSLSDVPPVYKAVGFTGEGLYEWTAGKPEAEQLTIVGVLPAGEGGEAVSARFVGPRGGISADGSRVFFTATPPGQSHAHLYMRDLAVDQTIRLDVAKGGSAVGQTGAVFQAASRDGSRAFFTSDAHLTGPEAGTNGSTPELYECQINVTESGGQRSDECDLTDLTPPPAAGQAGEGEPADVLGLSAGISQDGSYVYFVADGVQAAGAVAGQPNLYVRHEGATSLVATLSGDDAPDWANGEESQQVLKALVSHVSNGGEWLVFMSDRSLTGYDNRDVVSGRPDEEVYLYHYGAGVVCLSCDPTGARPSGVEYAQLNDRLVGGDRVWPASQWVAGNVPGWTRFELSGAAHDPRVVLDSGRVFFNSSVGLVAGDRNRGEDVYEFEPVGVGSCTSGSAGFVVGDGGCVGLVSSGVGVGESAFLDASVSGGDVFFLSEADLGGTTVSGLKVFDAHECTPSAPCAPGAAGQTAGCGSLSACRGELGAQPLFGGLLSEVIEGDGNLLAAGPAPKGKVSPAQLRRQRLARALKACKRKRKKPRRLACERAARRRYGAGKSKAKRRAASRHAPEGHHGARDGHPGAGHYRRGVRGGR